MSNGRRFRRHARGETRRLPTAIREHWLHSTACERLAAIEAAAQQNPHWWEMHGAISRETEARVREVLHAMVDDEVSREECSNELDGRLIAYLDDLDDAEEAKAASGIVIVVSMFVDMLTGNPDPAFDGNGAA